MSFRSSAVCVVAALVACAPVQQRFPDDVAAALARDAMRRLETDHFIIYYAAPRRAEIDRFAQRAERCATAVRTAALIKDGEWGDKMVVVMPDEPFNNAFVAEEGGGYETVAVIPTYSTLDFTSEFGLAPDPGLIACHELTHYVHFQQIAGFWRHMNDLFGHLYDPQAGFDPWVFEGLAVHYETTLNPGVGRPAWPLFTGIFAAAYAGGEHLDGGELSVFKRLAAAGHHYLVGGMFIKFLAETRGEKQLWATIQTQAHALDGIFSATSFKHGFDTQLGTLIDQFRAWTKTTYPVRARPAAQRVLAAVGNDARYARGRDGTEAWVADDVDQPTRLVVRDSHGGELASIGLVDVVPPRRLVEAGPLLVTGLSITADGNEVWLTALDTGATYEVSRLLRWRRGEHAVTEVQRDLGPGGSIDPRGGIYYYCAVDGDRWSLAAYDVRANTRWIVHEMQPGTYVTGARVSPDGARVVADVYAGDRLVEWELDAHTGAQLREIHGAGVEPVFDASYTSDGRLLWLGEVAGRFQVVVEGAVATDAPYAAFGAREANGTIRFLDREGWQWELAEIALPLAIGEAPAGPTATATATAATVTATTAAPAAPVVVLSDAPFSIFDHLFTPQLHSLTFLLATDETLVGVTLGGGDHLGLQRWGLTGYVQPFVTGRDHVHYGGDAQYLNMMLAPVRIYAEASQLAWGEEFSTSDGVAHVDTHRTRDALLSLSRTIRGSIAVGLTGLYTDDEQREPGFQPLLRHLAGPQLAVAYRGAEATRYAGDRRALEASAAAAYYPEAASSFASDIVDLGGALGVTAPLPLGRRHTLSLRLRGRALVSHAETGLLELGGQSIGATFRSNANTSSAPPDYNDSRFPPNLRFVEALRGYEDFPITTDRAGIADVTYRYPLVIDRGAASVLWVLPSTFVRELDVEVFGAGAVDEAHELHVAAGGALALSLALWRQSFYVIYQVARRVRDDDALVQLVGVGI